MECPLCKGVTLLITHREGIEIDYCPQCRGIWLDRGELEKLVSMADSRESRETHRKQRYRESVSTSQGRGDRGEQLYRRDDRDYREHQRYDRDHKEYDRRKPKKKESWLGELLDFFD